MKTDQTPVPGRRYRLPGIVLNAMIALCMTWMFAASPAMAQNRLSLKGTVTDETGQRLVGASLVVGTQGTVTNSAGEYILDNIPDNAIVMVSYLGYETQEIPVAGKTQLDIVMKAQSEMIGNVVVTALGIRRDERALGYAVEKVDGNLLQTVKPLDMGSSLTGKVAGLVVKNQSDFGMAPDVKIRGEYPLLVIDGVPYAKMSLRDVPNDDIESISVLKGATASALYGSRGANGAIMITTKSGADKRGLTVTINSSSMFAAGYLAIPEVQSVFGRNIANSVTYEYDRTQAGAWGIPMDGRDVVQWDPISKSLQSMPYLPRGKNNFRNFLRQSYILNNSISVTQQGEFGSLRASGTWVNNRGAYPNAVFNKYTFSLGGTMKWKNFSLSSTMTYNKQSTPNLGFNGYRGYDPMYSILLLSAPDFDIRDYKDYWVIEDQEQNNSYTTSHNNPYFDCYERIHSLDRDILNGMLNLEYKITDWLNASARIGYETYTDSQKVRISQGSYTGGGISTVIGGGTEIWGESTKGSFSTGLSRGHSINSDFIINADKDFGDFNINGLLGGSIYYAFDNAIEALTQGGLTIPGYYSLKASVNPLKVNSRESKQQINSLYGKIGASWRNMLFVEATLRNDWSSTLAAEQRSYLYPSIAGSFVVSEILPKTDWLSLWKIRGSWTVSKTPAGIYEINNVFSVTQNAWGNMTSTSVSGAIKNSDIDPYTTQTFEVGTAAWFFGKRLSLDMAYYTKRMYNMIVYAGVSAASGYSSKYINSKEEKTRRGVEISLSATPIKSRDFQWDISANWAKSVARFTQIDPEFTEDKPWWQVGKRTDPVIINDYLKDPDGNLIHVNGKPQYSAYQSVYGYSDPDWTWGLSTNFKYRNWSLGLSIDGRVGGMISSFTEAYMWRNGVHPESVTNERMLDANEPGVPHYIGKGVQVISGSVEYDTYGNITHDSRTFAPNDHAVTYKEYIEALHKNFAWGGPASSLDVRDGTFLKLRELSLTYTLPKKWCNVIRASDISVSAIGYNVLMWAKDFKYSDPDAGREDLSDPSSRYIGVNVKITF